MKLFLTVLLFKSCINIRSIQLKGNSTLGYYYMDVYVGSQQDKKSLIFDTGSHMTIFPCSGCKECWNHQNQIYQKEESKYFKPLRPNKRHLLWNCDHFQHNKCLFNQGYTEGSEYQGYLAQDQFLFENELKQKHKNRLQHIFGCATVERGEFYRQEVDGIIGFGVPRIEENSPPTILQIEKKEKRINSLSFSMCLGHQGGQITFGDWNKDLQLSKYDTKEIDTKSVSWAQQYKVPLNNIKIDNQSVRYDFDKINWNGGKAFLDSGTTFVYFDQELFNAFTQQISRFCGKKRRNCAYVDRYQECYHWNKTKFKDFVDFSKSFPLIKFDMNGTVLDWYPQDYLVEPLDGSQHMCIGVKQLKNAILGAVLLRNYDIQIDRSKQRILFRRANCDKREDYYKYYYQLDENQQKIPKKVYKIPEKTKKQPKQVKIVQNSIYINKQKQPIKNNKPSQTTQIMLFVYLLIFMLILGIKMIKRRKLE